MSVATNYVPVLKVRQGPLMGIAKATFNFKSNSIPLLEFLPPSTPDYELITDSKLPPQPILGSFIKQIALIAEAMNHQGKVFVDLHWLYGSALWHYPNLPGFILEQLHLRGVQGIPVIRTNTPPVTLNVFKRMQPQNNAGYLIRLGRLDMTSSRQLLDLTTCLQTPPANIDLLLDYGSILDATTDALLPSAIGYISDSLPSLFEWRSLTLASGAFPAHASSSPRPAKSLPRQDWRFWSRLVQQGLLRMPAFADYGPTHPRRPNPRSSLTLGASIWYTTDTHWHLIRGHGKTNLTIQDCCRQFINSPVFDHTDLSYGNSQLFLCGSGQIAISSAAEWSAICYNQHFEKVCAMLSPN